MNCFELSIAIFDDREHHAIAIDAVCNMLQSIRSVRWCHVVPASDLPHYSDFITISQTVYLLFSSFLHPKWYQSINLSGITPSYISYSSIGIFAVLLNELHKPWHPCHPATLFGSGGGRNHGDPGHERPHGPLAAALGGEWRHQHGGAGTSPGHGSKWDGRFRFVMSTRPWFNGKIIYKWLWMGLINECQPWILLNHGWH